MRKNIKLVIQYDGSEFAGWQRLGKQREEKSIQGVLEDALTEILSEPISIIGAGRTDRGVHAVGQTANFYTNSQIPIEKIQQLLNQRLPDAIAISEIFYVEKNFHSRYSAKSKTYEYRIDRREKCCVFTRKHTFHHPGFLDAVQMCKGAEYLIGTHDFKAFSTDRKDGGDTVREIYDICIEEKTQTEVTHPSANHEIVIQISGNGFLYNMVRIIVGTLIEVGEGKRKAEEMKEILDSLDRKRGGKTAEYQGLTLKKVKY